MNHNSRVSQAETDVDPVLVVERGLGQGWQVQVKALSRYVPTAQVVHMLEVSLTCWPEGQSPVDGQKTWALPLFTKEKRASA